MRLASPLTIVVAVLIVLSLGYLVLSPSPSTVPIGSGVLGLSRALSGTSTTLTPAVTVVALNPGDTLQATCTQPMDVTQTPNLVTIDCQTPTPSTTVTSTSTSTIVPTDTPTLTADPTDTATAVPTDTPTTVPTDTPTSTVTWTSTPTLTPTTTATVTVTSTTTSTAIAKWTGNLGFQVTSPNAAQWNANMRAGDTANIDVGVITTTLSLVTVGAKDVGLQLSGTAALPETQVSTANLAVIDAAFQAIDGPVAETIGYSDDNYNATVANHIAVLQATVSLVHNYPRANGAPPFKLMYIPSGLFLQKNLAANPLLATTPDLMMFQSQPFEDQATGADPTYISTVTSVVNQLRQDAPTHEVRVQVMVFSKSHPATVWSAAKMEADINAIGSATNPGSINIYVIDPGNPTQSQATFSQTLANYRP